MKTFDEYQTFTSTTNRYPREEMLNCLLMGLVSEVGEVCDKIKKAYRDHGGIIDRHAIAKELGDVGWYWSETAKELGFPLSTIIAMNVAKLTDRKERGKIGGSGDER